MLSSIYGIHDEAKDKEFELEMSWVCDESNRQHQKVMEILRLVNIFEFILLMSTAVMVTLGH